MLTRPKELRVAVRAIASVGLLCLLLVAAISCRGGTPTAPEEKPVVGEPTATVPAPSEVLKMPAGKIAFESHGAIHIINPDGSDEKRLTEGQRPRWSPDGEKILFGTRGGWGIINVDGSGKTIIPVPENWGTQAGYYVSAHYQWSPTGEMFLLAREGEGIYLVNVRDGSFTRVVEDEVKAAIFSPDGKKIAFLALGNGSVYRPHSLWVMNVDGTNRSKLKDGAVSIRWSGVGDWLTWSPDGEKITYDSWSAFFVIDSDGTNELSLGRGTSPIWLPDSKSLAYLDEECNIYSVKVDGTGRQEIARMRLESQQWILSPDGTKFALYLDDGIYTMNLDGSGLTRIVLAKGRYLDWSPR